MPTAVDPDRSVSAGEAPQRERAALDPRLKVLYLVATGIALFALSSLGILLGLLALQVLLWVASGYPLRDLARPLRRLLPLAALLVISAVVFASWGAGAPAHAGEARNAALHDGLAQALRLIAIVVASSLIQRGHGGQDFIAGVTRLGLPLFLGVAIEATLSLVAGSGARSGRGTGRGGGRGRDGGGGDGARDGLQGRRVLRQVLRGDIGFLVQGFHEAIRRTRLRMEPFRDRLGSARLDDLAVISAVAVLSATIRFVQIAPGLPIAPGHKGVVLIPLFILAGALTHSPWGATQAGAVMGIIAFLMGDGRFGIFEVFKYITPGLVVDGLLPLVERNGNPGRLRYCALGLLVAVSRFSTIVAVALFVGAPAGFLALLAPIGIAHAVFGALSGLVTLPLLRALRGTGRPPGPEPGDAHRS